MFIIRAKLKLDNEVRIYKQGNFKCITSNGSPNHEIGKFPTKGNPNKFKAQKINYCFPNNPIKKSTSNNRASTVGITLTGIPIRPGTAAWYDSSSPKKHSQNQSSGLNLEAIRPLEKIFGKYCQKIYILSPVQHRVLWIS